MFHYSKGFHNINTVFCDRNKEVEYMTENTKAAKGTVQITSLL